MPINWKRILILIGFIAGVILIGYLLYFFFLRSAIPPTGPDINANLPAGVLPGAGVGANIPTVADINGALPTNINALAGPPAPVPPGTKVATPVATGGLTQTSRLTSVQAYQPALAADGSGVVYYDKNTGLFYTINASGRTNPLSDKVFYEVENITWANDRQSAVLEYPDGSNIVYDFSTGQQITLPKHWEEFSFSPNSNQLVFKSMGTGEESRWLAVANTDGSSARRIANLGDKDATVHPDWSPNNQIVAMYREDKDFDRQDLYFVGLNNENFKSTIIEGRGFQGQWSTDGNRLLYSVYSSASGYKPTLWIVEAHGENIGQNRRALQLETWADKCTFGDNDSVYCAVPTSLSEGAGIFYHDLDNSPTDIYKIDLQTGFKSRIAVPEGNHNIESLVISDDGRYLYMSSKDDGRLYQIRLR